jgi:hypothetical protein
MTEKAAPPGAAFLSARDYWTMRVTFAVCVMLDMVAVTVNV